MQQCCCPQQAFLHLALTPLSPLSPCRKAAGDAAADKALADHQNIKIQMDALDKMIAAKDPNFDMQLVWQLAQVGAASL